MVTDVLSPFIFIIVIIIVVTNYENVANEHAWSQTSLTTDHTHDTATSLCLNYGNRQSQDTRKENYFKSSCSNFIKNFHYEELEVVTSS